MSLERRKVFLNVIGSIFALLCLIWLAVISVRQNDMINDYEGHLARGIDFHSQIIIPFIAELESNSTNQTDLFKLLLKSNCIDASDILKQDSVFVNKCIELGITIN